MSVVLSVSVSFSVDFNVVMFLIYKKSNMALSLTATKETLYSYLDLNLISVLVP